MAGIGGPHAQPFALLQEEPPDIEGDERLHLEQYRLQKQVEVKLRLEGPVGQALGDGRDRAQVRQTGIRRQLRRWRLRVVVCHHRW